MESTLPGLNYGTLHRILLYCSMAITCTILYPCYPSFHPQSGKRVTLYPIQHAVTPDALSMASRWRSRHSFVLSYNTSKSSRFMDSAINGARRYHCTRTRADSATWKMNRGWPARLGSLGVAVVHLAMADQSYMSNPFTLYSRRTVHVARSFLTCEAGVLSKTISCSIM